MHEMSLFESILHTNLINFLIVVGSLVLIFKKAHLGDLIQKMADDVRLSVEKSSNDTLSALNEYKEVKKSVKDTPKLQEEIIENAKQNAQNIKAKIQEKTEKEQNSLRKNIEKIFDSQKQEYKNLTVNDVYQASIELAKQEVLKRLNVEAHQKLINKSIEELDKIEGNLS